MEKDKEGIVKGNVASDEKGCGTESDRQKCVKRTSKVKVIGEWTLDRRLGRGSFAAVFLALHVNDHQRKAAVKAISRRMLNERLQKNLAKEILILQRIRHENIVRFFDTHQSPKHIYLVMEYCAGGDLHSLLHRTHGLSKSVVRVLMRQLSDGMEYLWSRNLIHRDLKPQNLLLNRRLRLNNEGNIDETWFLQESANHEVILKIADFGFATQLAEASMAKTMCGSPLYMAPEILNGDRYDLKSDIWSAGAIMYEMFFGEPPFTGSSPREVLKHIHRTNMENRIRKSSRISHESLDLLSGLLHLDPKKRIGFEEFYNHKFFFSELSDEIGADEIASRSDSDRKVTELMASKENTILSASTDSLPSSAGSSVISENYSGKNLHDRDPSTEAVKNGDIEVLTRKCDLSSLAETHQTVGQEAWEVLSTENLLSQQSIQRRLPLKKTRRKKLTLRRSSSKSDHSSSEIDQQSTSVHAIRYAGELCMRAATLADIASDILRPAGRSEGIFAESLARYLIQGISPQAVAFSVSVKALHILTCAMTTCNSVDGLKGEAILASARKTRDDIAATHAKVRDQTSIIRQQLPNSMDADRLPSANALLFQLMLDMSAAACSKEADADRHKSIDEYETAHLTLTSALHILELLCADSSFSQNENGQTLLQLRALFLQRKSSIKRIQSEILRSSSAS